MQKKKNKIPEKDALAKKTKRNRVLPIKEQ
jgi:hypothetical protein